MKHGGRRPGVASRLERRTPTPSRRSTLVRYVRQRIVQELDPILMPLSHVQRAFRKRLIDKSTPPTRRVPLRV